MRDVPDLRSVPLLLAALALASGIVLASRFGTMATWLAAFAFSLLGCLVLVAAARRWMPLMASLWQTLALGALLVALGGLRMVAFDHLPADHVGRLVPSDTVRFAGTFEGRVADAPVARASGIRFPLDADRLVLPETTLYIEGRVQVALVQSAWRDTMRYAAVSAGDRVRLTGVLRSPPLRRNPADFDYGAYLRRRGIWATFTVRDSADVVVRQPARPSPLRRLRGYLDATLARYVQTPVSRQVLTALVLGDRTLLHPDVRTAFVQTGLMHLLAVSGLHVLLVGMVLFGLLRPMLLRTGLRWHTVEVVRALLTLTVLVGYAALTGGSPSVVRAVVMAAVFIGGTVLQRPASPMNSLGTAALVLLLYRPPMLFEPGFQLSFAAVAGLVLLPVPVRGLLPDRRHVLRRWLAEGLLATTAATLATAPILLYHFGRLPLAGLVLNFAAIGVTLAAFAAALLACLLGLWPAVAGPFGQAADWLARVLVWLTQAGDQHLAGLAYEGYVTNGWALAALTALVLTAAAWPFVRVRFKLLAAALLLGSAGLWTGIAAGAHRPTLDVIFFDVGQGDAALVTLPGGRTLLVDTGLRDERSDSGLRTILPHLRRFGIRRLDAVVVTHPHADHLGGLPSLLAHVPVGRVFGNGEVFDSDLFAETLRRLDSLGLSYQPLRAGDTLSLDPAVSVNVLAPAEALAHPPGTNDASVVLRLAYGHTVFLLMGDAEAPSENRLVARYDTLLHSTVVKVGHHGSITSSLPELTARVKPAVAVVSVAAGNVYRLPSDSVLARWHAAGAHVHLTRDAGALWLRSDGLRLTTRTWKR